MRLSIAAVVLLASCGPKPITLPEEPVARAATCGVVAAADARKSGTGAVSEPLTLAQSGRVLHYSMLTASQGERFDTKMAAAVVETMPRVESGITSGKWQDLVAPCAAAYPAAATATPAALPADTLDAQLGCSVLGEFLSKSMAKQDAAYGEELLRYRQLANSLDGRVASKLAARGVRGFEATKDARDAALAKVVKLGSPVAVMDQCLAKYEDKA